MSWTKTPKRAVSGPSRAEAIQAFWRFWPTVSTAIAESIGAGGVKPELVTAINEHVHAIHPSLDWELGPGRESQHHLCLSGKGDPVLRVITEQWRSRAPARDETWEYYASRQPHARSGLVLELEGHRVTLDELAAAVTEDDAREVLDLVVYHPIYEVLESTDMRARIMFIGLDTLLGEDDVERWIGALDTTGERPADALPFPELPARIQGFSARCRGEHWVVLKGNLDGKPVFVSRNTALKRVDHLLLDTHVEIRVALRAPTPDGLTTNEEADELNAMEDALFPALGKDAVYVGRETHDGHRTLHLHVMESGPAAAKIHAWRARYPDRSIDVVTRADPRWDVLSRWS